MDGDRLARCGIAGFRVRRAIRLLTVDAEYYAGLNDAEGFRDPSEAWGQYELLLRAFAGVGEPPNQPQHLTGGA